MKTFAKLFSLLNLKVNISLLWERAAIWSLSTTSVMSSPRSTSGCLLLGTIGGLILGRDPGLVPHYGCRPLDPIHVPTGTCTGPYPCLGAAYTSTVAGGAVSAILLKIPGAPANIATTLDGHAMAQKGEGAKALQLSFLSSAVGRRLWRAFADFPHARAGEVGPCLWSEPPVLACHPWRDRHRDAGFQVLSSKGLLSGCIGLWLATIGFDDIMGAQRFIFHPSLGGRDQCHRSARSGSSRSPRSSPCLRSGRRDDGAEVISGPKAPNSRCVCRGDSATNGRSALALPSESIIGLIPGVGGQIAGLVAYDQSKKFSPDRDKFGTGHPEGLIAAESANNAMVGPSLVPLLTLSIPGSPTAAVLLGGLLIHGIFPGTDLFDNHPDVAWTFINSMLIGQILMCIFGLYVAGLAARVARVPHSVMAALFGIGRVSAATLSSIMGDVYVMASLGVSDVFPRTVRVFSGTLGAGADPWAYCGEQLYPRSHDRQCDIAV